MEYSQEILDFIARPDTVDFVARKSDYLLDTLRDYPEIVITQTLLDRFVIGYVSKNDYPLLDRLLGSGIISTIPIILGPLNFESLEHAGITQLHRQPYLNLTGAQVLVGIVDTGIDYTQPCFIYPDGTSKIQYIYDQTAVGTPPEGYVLGVEYTNQQINAALRAENPYEIVPQRDELGHGTFLASVAAGRRIDDFVGAAPNAEIVAVKLRAARDYYRDFYCVPPAQKYAYESTAVMVGVEYILQCARKLKRPVSICIALGSNFGGHDNSSMLEEYLSLVSDSTGVCITVAAGNESQAGHHTSGKIEDSGDTQNIDFRVGANAGDLCVSVWNTVADRFSVSVRSPSGELVGRIPARSGVSYTTHLIMEPTTITARYYFPHEYPGGQLTFLRFLNAAPGVWTITVHGDLVLDGTYHAWLPLTGFVAEDVEFLSPSPYYTVTVPATALDVISCGAYDSFNYKLYPLSSWGPTREPILVPDFVAPGVDIEGFMPYGITVQNGTSSAAAIATGAGAQFLQWGIVSGNDLSLSTSQIRAFLIRGCNKSDEIVYPNTQWGYGTLDVLQAFTSLRDT